MKSCLYVVIEEMMKEAAGEIGFQHCEENVEQVLIDLKHEYELEISESNIGERLTTKVMVRICRAIDEWKQNTKTNYPEQCKGA